MFACAVKSGNNYVDESSTIGYNTTWQPNNSGPSITTRPSDVDKQQDGLGEEESKEKRDADDRVENSAEDAEDAFRDAISANSTIDVLKKGTEEHAKSTYDGAIVKEDEEEVEAEDENSGNSSLEHFNTSALTKGNSTSAENEEEDEEDAKPRMIHLVRRPSHDNDHDNGRENETGEDEEEEDDDEDDDDDYEDEALANNVCTAGYFLDKIIPEDYPTEITKEVKHINETIERINRLV